MFVYSFKAEEEEEENVCMCVCQKKKCFLVAFLIKLYCIISHIRNNHCMLIIGKANIMRSFHFITTKMNHLLIISIVQT